MISSETPLSARTVTFPTTVNSFLICLTSPQKLDKLSHYFQGKQQLLTNSNLTVRGNRRKKHIWVVKFLVFPFNLLLLLQVFHFASEKDISLDDLFLTNACFLCFPPPLHHQPLHQALLDLNSECTYNCVSLFVDVFDSMPAQSPSTEPKAATTPSVDLFGAGTGVDIHYSLCGTSPSLLVSIRLLLLSHLFFHTSWFVPIVVWDLCMLTHSLNM